MTTSSNKCSLWLSTVPWGTSGWESSMVCLGSTSSWSYSLRYTGTATGILGSGSDSAIYVDGMGGAVGNISLSFARDGSSTYPDGLTNKAFVDKIENITKKIQMQGNAYVLRMYNFGSNDSYKDIYVFVQGFKYTLENNMPALIKCNLELIQRNKKVGFND